jgi:hypothetical protein
MDTLSFSIRSCHCSSSSEGPRDDDWTCCDGSSLTILTCATRSRAAFDDPLKSARILSYTVDDPLPGHFDLLLLLMLSVLSAGPKEAFSSPAFLEARGSLAAGVFGRTT